MQDIARLQEFFAHFGQNTHSAQATPHPRIGTPNGGLGKFGFEAVRIPLPHTQKTICSFMCGLCVWGD